MKTAFLLVRMPVFLLGAIGLLLAAPFLGGYAAIRGSGMFIAIPFVWLILFFRAAFGNDEKLIDREMETVRKEIRENFVGFVDDYRSWCNGLWNWWLSPK